MSTPLVSIVIPYYNKRSTINRSVQSVINQTYTNWELIIIDDKSPQELVFNPLWIKHNIQCFKNEINIGAGQSRQRGQEMAKGEYIAFLDADDWWANEMLQRCVEKLSTNVDGAGVYVQSLIKKDNSEFKRRYCDIGLSNITNTLIQFARPWQTGGILWRREFVGSWGNLKTNEDSWFEFNVSKINPKLVPVEEVLYFVDANGDGHLSAELGKTQSTIDQQELFIMVFEEFWNELALKYKIILYHRLIRGHLKIHEYALIHEKEMGRKLVYLNAALFAIHRYPFLLKLTHRILQKSPYKISF